MHNEIKKLEQEIVSLRNEMYQNLFPVFDDSQKIQDAIKFLDRSTAFEMQLLADIVLVTSPLLIKLDEHEESALFTYLDKQNVRIERTQQGVYTLFKQAEYEQLVDMRSGFWDSHENEAAFPLFSRTGEQAGYILECDIPKTKNIMIRTHTGGIKYNA